MTRMTPEDFQLPLLVEAEVLRRSYIAQNSSGYALDPLTCMWIIRREAWREFMLSEYFNQYVGYRGPGGRNELLGLPVRITVNDDADVPMIQLVMEPKLMPRKPRP